MALLWHFTALTRCPILSDHFKEVTWYPSMRLFRLKGSDDYPKSIDREADELRALVSKGE